MVNILPAKKSNQKVFYSSKISDLLVALFVITFLIFGILTLPKFGMTWDEGLGNMFFGERYLNYFLSFFNPEYLDFEKKLALGGQQSLSLFESAERFFPYVYPGFFDMLSAGSMYLFSYELGLLNPIDAFHLPTVILAGLFLWILYLFGRGHLGRFAALTAVLFLATFPRFWADMHFNVKDIPETIFFGMTIMAFFKWYSKPNRFWLVLTGFVGGLALGIKTNALFIPIILLAGTFYSDKSSNIISNLKKYIKSYWLSYTIMLIVAIFTYIASWPYLYFDTFNRLKLHFAYILSRGLNANSSHSDGLLQFITTIPEVMLVFLMIGLFSLFLQVKNNNKPIHKVLIFWFIIPLLRVTPPYAFNFDGIRHFMEFVPAAALISGYGASKIAHWAESFKPNYGLILRSGILFLIFINTFQIFKTYYPYSHLYYNQIIGGLAGAHKHFLSEEIPDYWGTSYRQGMVWLNQNAPVGSGVYGAVANWILQQSAPVLLRPDISIYSREQIEELGNLEDSNQPIYLFFARHYQSDSHNIYQSIEMQKPVYQILIDAVPIMKVYQVGGK